MIQLCHNRWSVPVLATLHEADGAKYATLLRRVGLGRDALSRTLRTLIEQGWVLKNPGYGHPLRPEYILSAKGKLLAPGCRALLSQAEQLELTDIVFNKWSIPVLLAIGLRHARFNQIKSFLGNITPAALTSTLKSLVGTGLVERTIRDAAPPDVHYGYAASARRFRTIIVDIYDRL